MRDFNVTALDIKQQTDERIAAINAEQLDVLKVIYYVYIQYRKYKSALRVLSVLLSFERDNELALLATVYCYFSMKRYRKSESLLKMIKSKMKSDKAKDMYDYLHALTMTEVGHRGRARKTYLKVKNQTSRNLQEED